MREAAVLLDLVEESGARAWLSYQCRDEVATAAGEAITDAVALANGRAGVVAVGVNCTAPRFVPALLEAAASATDLPLLAYPNGGDRWDAATRRWVVAEAGGAYDPAAVAGWADLGASWLGGCCGTGPDDIRALAGALG
jgi:homocysteine S-methyltransferase